MREQSFLTKTVADNRATRFGLLVLWSWLLMVWVVPVSIAGQACSECHTMHNSQNGSAVVGSGPLDKLLKGDCIGCHTGTNTSSTNTPYVHSTSAQYGTTGTENPDSNTLAGGNFRWVANDDAYGHNIAGLFTEDPLATADTGNNNPGFGSGLTAADGTTVGSDWSNNQLTCAGTYGCHGTHSTTSEMDAVVGTHHNSSTGAVIPSATTPTPADSFRALVGIEGYEDPDWEFQPTASAHNQYKGVDGAAGTDDTTISYLCGQCHGTFHQNSNSSSPWLRHPTDYDMANSNRSDYDEYNGGTGTNNTYSVVAPVASSPITSSTVPLSTVTPGTTATEDTIVTCISCHRAHGSPYYKMMRWDYATGTNWSYCAICHTTKD